MRVLVTGSSGFVGTNLVPHLKSNQIEVITLDKDPSTTGDAHILYRLGSFDGELHSILETCDAVIHLASESHVDRSITGPKEFIDNNVNGTLELFEACKPHLSTLQQIIQFSTDEVGACLEKGELTEEYKYHTGSVYSASKAAQELLAQAYIKTFNLPIVTTRCVNIFGAQQADEKFIPTVCRKALANDPIPVYGSGMQLRQWVSVEHVCEFINYVTTSNFIPPGSLLHITGTREIHNIMIAHTVLSLLEKPASLISHVIDRLGHDTRYALGRTEETDRFGCPRYEEKNFIEDLGRTVKWYEEKYGR